MELTNRDGCAGDEGADPSPAIVDRSLVDHPAGEEPIADPHVPDLEALGGQHRRTLAYDRLGRSTADVDHEVAIGAEGDRAEHTEMNEPGLFHARDHVDLDRGLGAGPIEEGRGILGFANGAGSDGMNVGVVGVGEGPERYERFDGSLDRRRVERLHVAGPRSEAYRYLFPEEQFRAASAAWPGDREVYRGRADVDRRQVAVARFSHRRPPEPGRPLPIRP